MLNPNLGVVGSSPAGRAKIFLIAQWVPREGLGWTNENDALLRDLCLRLTDGNKAAAEQQLADYHAGVARRFDQVLNAL